MKRLFKSFAAIVTTVLYLLTTTGFAVHECKTSQLKSPVFSPIFSEDNTSCCSGKHKENHGEEERISCGTCCSLTYKSLESEHNYTQQIVQNQIFETLVAVAAIPSSLSIPDIAPAQKDEYYPPPCLFGETLPIYYFCQLRL
ncbi:MAG: hypothetical protein LBS07_04260 [Prevotellaceae bacterium]|jgi:hypothetical protein|nr:hypothetical protein [Prevotellaceae bacterium]